jgi:hypothetical protein
MTDPRHTEPAIHETTTEARAGSTPGVARVVLVVGTLLTIILFAIIVLVGRS